jgi:TnpA family transposase
MTDTGAYSDVVFGLFRLLGYRLLTRFMPEKNLDAANDDEQNDLWDIERKSTLNVDVAPPRQPTPCCCSG